MSERYLLLCFLPGYHLMKNNTFKTNCPMKNDQPSFDFLKDFSLLRMETLLFEKALSQVAASIQKK